MINLGLLDNYISVKKNEGGMNSNRRDELISKRREAQEALINGRRRRREEERKVQAEEKNLYTAIDYGYVEAVERLINADNVNQVLEEPNQTPLRILTRRLLTETQRHMLSRYNKILNILLKAGADPSFISDQDCFVINQFTIPLYKDDLPNAKSKYKYKNNGYIRESKFAKDVFNGQDFEINFLQNIGVLGEIGQEELNNYLYKKEDFTIYLADGLCGRDKMGVKLGKIYIEYRPDGKQGFEANVYLINAENKTLSLLHEFTAKRYSGLKFEAFIPFDLGSFYGSMTNCPPDDFFDFAAAREVYRNSYFLKNNLIQLALNESRKALVYVVTEGFDNNTCRISNGRIFRTNEELEAYLKELDKNVFVFRMMTDDSFIQPTDTEIKPCKPLDLKQLEYVEFTKVSAGEKDLKVVQLDFKDTGVGTANSNTQTVTASAIAFSRLREEREADINRIPDEFLCPISRDVMEDPVTTITGHTYDRKLIEEWIKRCKANGDGTHVTNPMDREDLGQDPILIPNTQLKDAIDLYEEIRRNEIAAERNAKYFRVKRLINVISDVDQVDQSSSSPYDELPFAFRCSGSGELMQDPMITPSGNSYECKMIKSMIEEGLYEASTGETLTINDLVPNRALKDAIQNWENRKAKFASRAEEREQDCQAAARRQEERDAKEKEKGAEPKAEMIAKELMAAAKSSEELRLKPEEKEKEKEPEEAPTQRVGRSNPAPVVVTRRSGFSLRSFFNFSGGLTLANNNDRIEDKATPGNQGRRRK